MKKIILTLVFCLIAAGASLAQNNVQGMRFLIINSLVDYGQKLYDRGDFDEACAVFNHVLVYDHHQPLALRYLKEMGHLPAAMASPALLEQLSKPAVPSENKIAVKKSAVAAVAPVVIPKSVIIWEKVDIADTQNLKAAIEAKKKAIEKLRGQIMRMRANIASVSTEE